MGVFCAAKPTADEVLEGVELAGRRTIVTGSNAGIGFETARALAKAGATVIVACRSQAKAKETTDRLRELVPGAELEPSVVDLSSLASVGDFVRGQRGLPIDAIVCNAGLYPATYAESKDGHELCFAVCHLAHFAMVRGLWSEIRGSKSRIVMVSSGSHRMPKRLDFSNLPPKKERFSPLKAYGQAKLCNVLFAIEIDRRLGDEGVRANALHPGNLIATSIGRDSLAARLVTQIAKPWTKSLAQGAATSVYVAASPDTADARGLYFEDCQVGKASDEARDPEVARKLWELSEELVAGAIPIGEGRRAREALASA